MTEPAVDFGGLAQRGYRFALSLTHDSALADDLVQDVWLSVLTTGGPLQHPLAAAVLGNRAGLSWSTLGFLRPVGAVEGEPQESRELGRGQAFR